MEERIGRIEASIEHMHSDIADIRIDIRRLNDKLDGLDQKLTAKIDGNDQKQSAKSDSLMESITTLTLTVEKSFAELKMARAFDRVLWLLMSGALLVLVGLDFK